MSVRRTALILPVVLFSVLALQGGPVSSQATGVPVEGSVQHIYRPGHGHGVISVALSAEELERYLVPPLELQATYVGNTAAEPTIGITRDGTAFFAASTLVVDTPVVWGVAKTDTRRSRDGGLTWQSVQFPAPGTPAAIPPGNADPFVWVDQATDRIFNIDLYAACSWLNYSDTMGDSWLVSPLACGNPVNDHHTIVSGKPIGGYTTTLYPRILYYCFNRIVDAACGRSLDGGVTWTPTGSSHVPPTGSNCAKLHGHIRTDPDGRLFVPLGRCGNVPGVAISSNAGDTWTRVNVSTVTSATTHTSLASDTAGNLYYVWYDASLRLPYLAYSTDHGTTWSEPLMIGPPGVTEVNFPTVTAGDPGHVAVNFPSSTDADRQGSSRPWDQTVTVSYNVLDEDPIFHSATANPASNPIHRGNCNSRCAGLWDFLDVTTALQGEAWAAASDDCIGTCNAGATSAAKVGDGLAIRQIGGPCVLTPTDLSKAVCDVVPENPWLPEV